VSPTVWYFARSAGVVAYLLLSAAVVAGTLMSGRATLTWPRFAVEELHRFLAVLTGIFVVLHGASLLLDKVVPISLAQELVPFTSHYRPLAVGLGATTAELLAAVGLTNLFRQELPQRFWRHVHYLTIPAWILATLHGLLAGSDVLDLWFAGIAAAAITAVGLAFAFRTRGVLAA
jgi:predicted ferric reductase